MTPFSFVEDDYLSPYPVNIPYGGNDAAVILISSDESRRRRRKLRILMEFVTESFLMVGVQPNLEQMKSVLVLACKKIATEDDL